MTIISFYCAELPSGNFMLIVAYGNNIPFDRIMAAVFHLLSLADVSQPFIDNYWIAFQVFLPGSLEQQMTQAFVNGGENVSGASFFAIRVLEMIPPPVQFADNADDPIDDDFDDGAVLRAAFQANFDLQRPFSRAFRAQLELALAVHRNQHQR